MMNIANITLPNGLVLAPMAGVTDRPFRRLCRSLGAEMTVTEMVSAKAMQFGDKKTYALAALDKDEAPAAVQIFGSEPEVMANAARMLLQTETPPAIIDINMGCPMKKIVSNGEGSRLMLNPSLAHAIIRAVKDAVHVPVTVKFRTGWDAEHISAPEFAKVCQDAGADAITIHGRTREQMYAPPVDLVTIAAVKKAVTIPVIGNGDILSSSDARRMLEETGVDGIAIGRGSMGNPWIFSEIRAALAGTEFVPPTFDERMKVALSHLDALIGEKGSRIGICEGRRQLSYYIAGLPGSATARDAINRAATREEMVLALQALIERNSM